MFNVLLCIENRIYREGLKSILQDSGRVSEVHLCAEARQLAAIAQSSHCDLILIDVSSGRSATDPVELVAAASRAARGLPVVALGLSESDDEVLAFIEAAAMLGFGPAANDGLGAPLQAAR